MADKKISELPLTSVVSGEDISLLVKEGADYKFAFASLLQFVSDNLTTGAKISFGTSLPLNTIGKNGDIFIKTDTGAFAQKISGTWTIVYTLPSTGGITDGTVLYGLGAPGSMIGNDNDTYINTATGIFYKKASGTWAQAFSMQTGPQGPQGTPGANGTNGTNGFSVLNGAGIPSNSITGVNGDFYINISNYTFYGPKTDDMWGDGVSLLGKGVVGGGNTGQVLVKSSNVDYDLEWATVDVSFSSLEGTPADNTALATALNNKVDKVEGYGLSQENFSSSEKDKLATLSEHYKGTYLSLSALESAEPTANAGDYAYIDTGTGLESKMYIWDEDDNIWVLSSGSGVIPDATETSVGLIELATIAEALARTDDQRAMTALKTIALIIDEKKKVSYQINPVGLNEVSILMENAGQVNSVLVSGANTVKLKIGISGSYPGGSQTYPFGYAANDRVFITYNYTDLNNASCNVKLKCQDN